MRALPIKFDPMLPISRDEIAGGGDGSADRIIFRSVSHKNAIPAVAQGFRAGGIQADIVTAR